MFMANAGFRELGNFVARYLRDRQTSAIKNLGHGIVMGKWQRDLLLSESAFLAAEPSFAARKGTMPLPTVRIVPS